MEHAMSVKRLSRQGKPDKQHDASELRPTEILDSDQKRRRGAP
jgi:hypothetical protein